MRRKWEDAHYYYGPRMNGNERESLEAMFTAVIGAGYEVSNQLGCGFLEKVYERALVRELALRGFKAKTQVKMPVWYKEYLVGDYIADLLIDERLVIELKCVECLTNEHLAQCINYLKASGRHLALLINFQKPKVEWKRIVHEL
jgi:GxxExxY protein